MAKTRPLFCGSESILLLDGGVSTHLESKLLSANPGPPFPHRELWSSSLLLTADGRTAIRECHDDFLRKGGADIISTVTYQAHYMPIPGKEDHNTLRLVDSVVDNMLREGIRLAREASEAHNKQTGKRAYVAASIGSLGGALADGSEYTGKFGLNINHIAQFHRRKLQVLIEERPDIIAFETIPCIDEIEAIFQVIKEMLSCKDIDDIPPIWLSLACSDGEHLNDGSKFIDALSKVDDLDPQATLIQAIGINCCSCNHGKL